MAKYDEPEAGEIVFPIRSQKYRMACCDCGLVHEIDFGVYKTRKLRGRNGFRFTKVRSKTLRVGFRVWRNNRATAAIRRAKGKHV